MFYVYGFDLSDRIWLVSIVMVLVVAWLFGCVFTTILTVTPYISALREHASVVKQLIAAHCNLESKGPTPRKRA